MKEHEPTPHTRQLVEMLALAGYQQSQIAKCVTPGGISVPTLKKHYPQELDISKMMRGARVAGMAYMMAMGRPAQFDEHGRMVQEELKPNPSMVMFLCKTQLGWKETSVLELSDPTAGARDRLAGEVDRLLATFNGDGGAAPGPAAPAHSERLN